MRNFFVRGSVLAAMLAGTAAIAQTPTNADEFVAQARAGDLFQKQAGMVMEHSEDPKIRMFAMKLLRSHMRSMNQIKMAAQAAGIRPAAPSLDSEQAQMLADLKAARGSDQVALYLKQEKRLHQQMLTLMAEYISNGDQPKLQTLASQIAPVIEHHSVELKTMDRRPSIANTEITSR
jgi:predicted outer membrane protein